MFGQPSQPRGTELEIVRRAKSYEPQMIQHDGEHGEFARKFPDIVELFLSRKDVQRKAKFHKPTNRQPSGRERDHPGPNPDAAKQWISHKATRSSTGNLAVSGRRCQTTAPMRGSDSAKSRAHWLSSTHGLHSIITTADIPETPTSYLKARRRQHPPIEQRGTGFGCGIPAGRPMVVEMHVRVNHHPACVR